MSPWPVGGARSRRFICRARATPIWWERRSTSRQTFATSSSGHPRARPPRGSRAAALCKAFLRALGVEVHSHVIQIASVHAPAARATRSRPEDFAEVDSSPVRCLDDEASRAMVREIDELRKANESLGGVFEVQAFGLVPGLGSYVSWEERLDGRLAMAICSIQAIKGVVDRRRLHGRRPAGLAGA